MNAISKIRAAGFTLEIDGDGLAVSPFSELTDDQLAYLKAHKAEILEALHQEGTTAKNARCFEAYAPLARHLAGAAKETECCKSTDGIYCEFGEQLRQRYMAQVNYSIKAVQQQAPAPTSNTEAEAIPLDGNLQSFPAMLEHAA